jgi:hypothetical protein
VFDKLAIGKKCIAFLVQKYKNLKTVGNTKRGRKIGKKCIAFLVQ